MPPSQLQHGKNPISYIIYDCTWESRTPPPFKHGVCNNVVKKAAMLVAGATVNISGKHKRQESHMGTSIGGTISCYIEPDVHPSYSPIALIIDSSSQHGSQSEFSFKFSPLQHGCFCNFGGGFCWCPCNKSSTILGSTSGPLILGDCSGRGAIRLTEIRNPNVGPTLGSRIQNPLISWPWEPRQRASYSYQSCPSRQFKCCKAWLFLYIGALFGGYIIM